MSKVRKTIVLFHQERDKSFINRYQQLSRNTVKKYLTLYHILNLDIDKLTQKSNAELEQLFSSNKPMELSPKLQAGYDFFPYMEKELKRTGVTKQLLWKEYIKKHPDSLRSSQFMDRYMKWTKKANPVSSL
jgi:hypothetical protein